MVSYRTERDTVGQYTGLHDEMGTPLYEQDVVRINDHAYRIAYKLGSFMLVRQSDETDLDEEFDDCWNDDCYPLSQYYWNNNFSDGNIEGNIANCKIVGNIHNDPISEIL